MQIFSSRAGVKLDGTKTGEDTNVGTHKTRITQETRLELRIREGLSNSETGVKVEESKTRKDTKTGTHKTGSTQETRLELRIREDLSKQM